MYVFVFGFVVVVGGGFVVVVVAAVVLLLLLLLLVFNFVGVVRVKCRYHRYHQQPATV